MQHEITQKVNLNSEDYLIEIKAPLVAERFRAGHFVVLLTHPKGERIPMSVLKVEEGTVSVLIKRLGKTSRELDMYKVGDTLESVIGPMGNPVELKEYGNVVFASDLVCGHAENYAVSKALREVTGNHVISMQAFPTKDMIYLEEELRNVSDEYHITTQDGSYGIKGHYLDVLEELLENGKVDMVFAAGDMPSLRKLADITKLYNVPAMVTLRPIMVDATGMCGSCRVFIDGEMKLTCIDGPMFDAHKVNFDEVISAMSRFHTKQAEAMESYENCSENSGGNNGEDS